VEGTMDETTPIETLKKKVIEFRNARNWEQFHDPRNLAAGLSIESAELQEIFLWKSKDKIKKLLESKDGNDKLKEELADIFVFLLYLSEGCGIDLSEAVINKIKLNENKYPVDKSYNSHKKYNEL
jgi:NTP pyrophosphatase (non-canonical NTP hydrolase)